MSTLTARALAGLPEITSGMKLGQLIAGAAEAQGVALGSDEVVVVAQKAVSKAEGRVVALGEVSPGPRASELAREHGHDARAVQVVLDESVELVRAERGVLICRTRHGLVCANAGVDASNAPAEEVLVLLPVDPDASARALRGELRSLSGAAPAVVITDSFGRAWRHGQCDVAIGIAGLSALEDWRGRHDSAGRELRATWIAVADQLAGAADLVRSKDSSEPVVIVSGLAAHVTAEDGPGATALVRPLEEDLFR
ncbi:MAG TPA: coenzyme F420-0:L-glutamate ligase [Solirubrobacteraceae bacterium]|jgi:coenzyme F420-0:L-glutamate ligase/coenzyme F420-1:gamma-L-glutamate ligase|nr:coenzyme F420-0:L-glutamate ligase [Solirubrobacteraceae bacterium]